MKPLDFFAAFAKLAQDSCHGTGLCASVALAQAAIESGWGESGLTKRANNFGGIKAGSTWKGKVLVLPTREVIKGKSIIVQAAFRAFDSPADYFKKRVEFLRGLSRYRPLFAADDYVAEAHLFQQCGYATDPQYGNTLARVVKQYGLTKYDDARAQPTIKADSARPLTAAKAA
jgi:flagellum-specific peptidoglycan hydrolase FlgJ